MQREGSGALRGHWNRVAVFAVAFLAAASPAPAQQKTVSTTGAALERIKQTGRIRLGYRTDMRPFSFGEAAGRAAGYSVTLCQKVTDALKTELGLTTLAVEWVPVGLADRVTAVQQGKVDLLCGAETETITRRREVAFSIPIFPGGIGALMRTDAPARLEEILSGRPPSGATPTWRASAGQLVQAQKLTVVRGTTAEPWLARKLNEFNLTPVVAPVDDYPSGFERVLDRSTNVFFADRAILLDVVANSPFKRDLKVMDRFFTYEPIGLVLARGDDAFRLVVDRTLSRLYASPEFRTLYVQWFGEPSAEVLTFYRWNTRPE